MTKASSLNESSAASVPGPDQAPAAPSPLDPARLALVVEAVLISTDRPLPTARILEALGGAGEVPGNAGCPGAKSKDILQAIAALNQLYDESARSFRIEELAGGWQILTRSQFAPILEALHKSRTQTRLSPAAMETLAIIAYKQPILRAEIEAIRGVAAGEVLRSLMERRLVKIVGRAEEIGRPMLYGTTKSFLETFGLASLKDLPKIEDLKQPK